MTGKRSPFEGFDLAGQVASSSKPLDQQLFTSRRPQAASPDAPHPAPVQGEEATPETGKQGIKETSIPVSPEASAEANKPQPTLQKATFALPVADVDALDDIKRMLKREHGIRVSKERIVAEAIRHFYADLEGNKETSFLVRKLTGKEGGK